MGSANWRSCQTSAGSTLEEHQDATYVRQACNAGISIKVRGKGSRLIWRSGSQAVRKAGVAVTRPAGRHRQCRWLQHFQAMSAKRLLMFGGIALIAGGMFFGDIFAVFVLHQNGGETGAASACGYASGGSQNPAAVKESVC